TGGGSTSGRLRRFDGCDWGLLGTEVYSSLSTAAVWIFRACRAGPRLAVNTSTAIPTATRTATANGETEVPTNPRRSQATIDHARRVASTRPGSPSESALTCTVRQTRRGSAPSAARIAYSRRPALTR